MARDHVLSGKMQCTWCPGSSWPSSAGIAWSFEMFSDNNPDNSLSVTWVSECWYSCVTITETLPARGKRSKVACCGSRPSSFLLRFPVKELWETKCRWGSPRIRPITNFATHPSLYPSPRLSGRFPLTTLALTPPHHRAFLCSSHLISSHTDMSVNSEGNPTTPDVSTPGEGRGLCNLHQWAIHTIQIHTQAHTYTKTYTDIGAYCNSVLWRHLEVYNIF